MALSVRKQSESRVNSIKRITEDNSAILKFLALALLLLAFVGTEASGNFDDVECIYTPCEPKDGLCEESVNSCIEGQSSSPTETPTQYRWVCLGINGGKNRTCALDKEVPQGIWHNAEDIKAGTFGANHDQDADVIYRFTNPVQFNDGDLNVEDDLRVKNTLHVEDRICLKGSSGTSRCIDSWDDVANYLITVVR